ncbi:UDP-3-O-(3-hydroxymyristoyl)glucosamine N-acyltransferase [Oleidesulfovibrio sp.]|uniref:UDP-3-O-(3-hydroxymyristoyl)glucosamine N-acyltransferase n=1 Tax=Oleidesulfovibrio sp. TaxID=2909707 RepID=UPI003A87C505
MLKTVMKVSDIAKALGLTLKGPDCEVSGMNTLEGAGPEELSFLANPKYIPILAGTRAAAVIVSEEFADQVETALISANPYFDFGRTLHLFAKPQGNFSGISDMAYIHPEAEVADGCTVYPNVYIGARAKVGKGSTFFPGCYIGEDCTVGENCTFYPNVTLMAATSVGDDCVFHAGVVLGADGFGFARTDYGIQKIPQIGRVEIGNDVEIGANTAIDRAVLGVTTVGDGTKVDNLVQVGHNVTIGNDCLIVSQVGISGSTQVGNRVTMAGQVGVAGHISIGDDVTLGPKAGVAKSIEAGKTMGGQPAVERDVFMRTLTVMPKLPDMYKRLRKIEKELEALKADSSKDS